MGLRCGRTAGPCVPVKLASNSGAHTPNEVKKACHKTHPEAKRFVTTEYWFDEKGRPTARMPEHCPMGADGSKCRIRKHSTRDRKTGPEHPLVVVKCIGHGIYFTLYPPGHVPYGRKRVVPDDAHGQDPWRRTQFKAAVEAAAGEPAWSREPDGGPGWWTQRRQIERAAEMLGLTCPARQAERVADALSAGVLAHAQARRQYGEATGFRGRAQAVVRVLDVLSRGGLLERLLLAGHLAGTLPEPWIWTGQGYPMPFH